MRILSTPTVPPANNDDMQIQSAPKNRAAKRLNGDYKLHYSQEACRAEQQKKRKVKLLVDFALASSYHSHRHKRLSFHEMTSLYSD